VDGDSDGDGGSLLSGLGPHVDHVYAAASLGHDESFVFFKFEETVRGVELALLLARLATT